MAIQAVNADHLSSFLITCIIFIIIQVSDVVM